MNIFHQVFLKFPFQRKVRAFEQVDGTIGSAFRNHVQLALELEDKRVGQMVDGLQHSYRGFMASILVQHYE